MTLSMIIGSFADAINDFGVATYTPFLGENSDDVLWIKGKFTVHRV
jgi:hypothetical protein